MSQIDETADTYEKDYTFMAVNATIRHAEMFHRLHDEQSVAELKDVRDELIRRGRKLIQNEEEYNAGIANEGVPPAFSATANGAAHEK